MNQNEEINYRKISDEIRRYFAGHGISINAAAERLGMNQPSLSTALSGRKITKRFALLLSSAFPFNVDYLTTGEGNLLKTGAAVDGYFAPVKDTGGTLNSEEFNSTASAGNLIERIMSALEDATKTAFNLSQENREMRAYIQRLEKIVKSGADLGGMDALNAVTAERNRDRGTEYIPVSELIERAGK